MAKRGYGVSRVPFKSCVFNRGGIILEVEHGILFREFGRRPSNELYDLGPTIYPLWVSVSKSVNEKILRTMQPFPILK